MSVVELKHKITDQISKIDDFDFLNAVVSLIEGKQSNEIYELSDYQINRIEKAREELSKGVVSTNEEVQEEVKKWLKSK